MSGWVGTASRAEWVVMRLEELIEISGPLPSTAAHEQCYAEYCALLGTAIDCAMEHLFDTFSTWQSTSAAYAKLAEGTSFVGASSDGSLRSALIASSPEERHLAKALMWAVFRDESPAVKRETEVAPGMYAPAFRRGPSPLSGRDSTPSGDSVARIRSSSLPVARSGSFSLSVDLHDEVERDDDSPRTPPPAFRRGTSPSTDANAPGARRSVLPVWA